MDFKGHLEDDVFIFDKPERVNYYDLFEQCGKHGIIMEKGIDVNEEYCLCYGYATTTDADSILGSKVKKYNMQNFTAMFLCGDNDYGKLSI